MHWRNMLEMLEYMSLQATNELAAKFAHTGSRGPASVQTYQVEREAVVGEHDDEEDDVHQEVQHVGHQLQVEHVHALQAGTSFNPAFVQACSLSRG